MKTFAEFLIEERIDEMATVARDKENGILIQVNPDRGRIGMEYFKIYNSYSVDKADKMTRISFRKAEYISHSATLGKKDWKLSTKEKKALIALLEVKSKSNPQYTNWEYAILSFNNEKGLDFDQTEENVIDNLKYPQYLPIDLPMPDYSQLA